MVQIICYPHPTLRHVSKPLKRVDAELRKIVAQMLELMYANKGIGLAANQVNLPYRLFVMNIEGNPDAHEAQHVLINPVLSRPKGIDEAEEGCLSLPGVVGMVKRAATIRVTAYGLDGREISTTLAGLTARVVQHEADHLDGRLFIDRLSPTGEMEIRETLREFELQFVNQRQLGQIPHDDQIAAHLAHLETIRA
ncbi:MAG: peptide deformylase [Planctomycetes bacterium RBG_16_64_10]|nr:MAG: peptide deformylase [Planctomycetes bacterium RBG_16_64_10]